MIAVRLKDDEFVALEQISKREDLPLSYFVREGVALVIEKYVKKREPTEAGLATAGTAARP